MFIFKKAMFAVITIFLFACHTSTTKSQSQTMNQQNELKEGLAVATLGGGCFWCVEAVFQRLEGVEKVVSGYAAGDTKNPTYKEICSGNTGHAEVVQVFFDPNAISYEEILEVFWTTHDPTTLNRQGNDVGTQYRSIIIYHSEEQKETAEKSIKEVATKLWDDPIVTQVVEETTFYPAEDYHQEYYNNNSSQPYCSFVISPKIDKLKKKYKNKLKEEYKEVY